MAVNPNIKKKADDIRNKIYGKEVRESLASGLEEMSSDVVENEGRQSVVEGRQDSVESQWQVVSDEMTDKDVISAPEIISARNGKPNLKARLDGEHDEVTAQLAEIKKNMQFVTYEVFREDNLSDEEIIKNTHDYANQHNLPVVNLSGEYWLKEPLDISIKTNVFWGETIFHIDESKNDNILERFIVESYKEPFNITLDSSTKASVLSKMKPGVSIIPELAEYKNCLVFIVDDNIKMGARYGFGGVEYSKEEFFFVEEGGKVIGELAYEFNDYTSLVAYPVDDNYLTIDGGTFYLSGKSNEGISRQEYVNNGFKIKRSRVKFQNQWIGLEIGTEIDITYNSMYGFYAFDRTYDVEFENIRVVPRLQDKGGHGIGTAHGTYAFHGHRVLDLTLDRVTSEGGENHWGTIAVDFMKDLKVKNSKLNRVDGHYHAWNISITDTVIGAKTITVSGGGDLNINNVTVHSNMFIKFRTDYGSKWDGDINVYNSKLVVPDYNFIRILDFAPTDFDYKYPIIHGKKINIKGFTFDMRSTESNNTIELVGVPDFGLFSHGDRIQLASEWHISDVKVVGRDKKVGRFFRMDTPTDYYLPEEGHYDTVNKSLTPNCKMVFENIEMDTLVYQPQTQMTSLPILSDHEAVYDSHSLMPEITIKNCSDLSIFTGSMIADIYVENSNVINLDLYDKGVGRTAIDFFRVTLQPNIIHRSGEGAYFPMNERHHRLISCTFDQPIVDGSLSTDVDIVKSQFHQFFLVDDYVNFMNLGNRMTPRLQNVLGTGTEDFKNQLQSSYDERF